MNELDREDMMVSYKPLTRNDWEIKISETNSSICVFMVNRLNTYSIIRFFQDPVEAMYWIEHISEKY